MDRIVARNDPPYFVVRSAWRADERVVVICRPPVELIRGHVLDLAGTIQTLQSGERCIVNPTIYARLEQNGSISNRPALFNSLPVLESRLLAQPDSPIPLSDPSLPDDGLGVPGPVTAWFTDSAWQGASVSQLLANPPPLLSRVVLSCKPIRQVGDGFIVVGDDDTASGVKVYTNNPVKSGDRLGKLIGYAHSENGTPVIYADSGPSPYYDAQGELGSVFSATYGTVAWAKSKASTAEAAPYSMHGRAVSGSARLAMFEEGEIELEGMVVTAVFYQTNSSTIDFFYIQDPDVPSGIKVVPPSGASVEIRDRVTVSGTVISGNSTGEAYINAASVTKTGSAPLPKPFGMPNRSTAGGEFGAQPGLYLVSGLGVGSGLNAVGIRVKVWGKVTYVSGDQSVCCIDDGSGLLRLDHDGLKVIYYRAGDHPPFSEGDFVTVTGILGAEKDGNYPRSCDSSPQPARDTRQARRRQPE